MKSIFIVNQTQFGYQTDYYEYVKHLSNRFAITYVCMDEGYDRIVFENARIIYIARKANWIYRHVYFFIMARLLLKRHHFDLFYVGYYKGCSLLKVFTRKKKFVLDIRSSNISKHNLIRYLNNKLISIEASFFSVISVISEGVSNLLDLEKKKPTLIPLGASTFCVHEKEFNNLNLLYVGTLHLRQIHLTIEGFYRFYQQYSDKIPAKYTIIGFSVNNNEEEVVRSIISKYNLQEVVCFLGRKSYNELPKYFENSNVGVSFIPITEYFNYQPPTKTFEYLLSGMPVLATKTAENLNIINDAYGELIDDNSESFCKGLVNLVRRLPSFNSKEIRNLNSAHLWTNIVETYVYPFLIQSIEEGNH